MLLISKVSFVREVCLSDTERKLKFFDKKLERSKTTKSVKLPTSKAVFTKRFFCKNDLLKYLMGSIT